MLSIKSQLSLQCAEIIQRVLGMDADAGIEVAGQAQFGDYQANGLLKLAKILKQNPKALADQVATAWQQSNPLLRLEPSGPGFINIYLSNDFVQTALSQLWNDPRLGIAKTTDPKNIVVDYGGANVAKEMHVGHLRSAVIGDAVVRILDFLGEHPIRQNHIGDWGTQFGMLIEHILEHHIELSTQVSDLDQLYKTAKQRFDNDNTFAERSRLRVVTLQQGDQTTLMIWRELIKVSEQHFEEVYRRLGVLLTHEDICGESFFNDQLPLLIEALAEKELLQDSDGAKVMLIDGYVDRDQKPLPLMLRKSDGGYLYATTDLAAMRYRIEQLRAQEIIYVTDARQKQHFAMLFAALEKTGWLPTDVKLQHLPFGAVLGADRKPFKTRSGESIKLVDLIQESMTRAADKIKPKNPNLDDAVLQHLAREVGVGALKYADLASDKVKDYIFDWDLMLAFEGNTAPYLQNAYVRIRAIFRKGDIQEEQLSLEALHLHDDIEKQLAVKVLSINEIVSSVRQDWAIQRLCHYLFELASLFHRFYEQCPVLTAATPESKQSRLLLCALTARVLKLGLSLLGIGVFEQM